MSARHRSWLALPVPGAPPGMAEDRTVCATGCDAADLGTLFAMHDLEGGDRVFVAPGTYGPVSIPAHAGGSADNPVQVIGLPDAQGNRPRLEGGLTTLTFDRSNHVWMEGFDISGGSHHCVFMQAHDVTLRDSLVHDCDEHGILGADDFSGSFTLEYSEVFDAGDGQQKHPLYMQSDETNFPGSVVRIRHNYIHGGNGGNLLKVRHERAEIHYNWFEGAEYQEIELIGPDIVTQPSGWHEDKKREDADLVGNVIVHTSGWRNAIRIGGDLNGRSKGRVRLLNNTIVFDAPINNGRAVLVQLGAESLEMHNNVVYQLGGARAAVVAELVVQDDPPWGDRNPWVDGRRVHGSNNWIEQGSLSIPPEFSATRTGSEPDFADGPDRDFFPTTAELIDEGNPAPAPAPGQQLPVTLARAEFMPQRRHVRPGQALPRPRAGIVDIGAFEAGEDEALFRDGFE